MPLRHSLPDFLYGASELVYEDERYLALFVHDVPHLAYRFLGHPERLDPAYIRYRFALVVLGRGDMKPRDIVCLKKEDDGSLSLCRMSLHGERVIGNGESYASREIFLDKAATLTGLSRIREKVKP
ncbi:MAG: hypothetical protein D6721_04190 [Gammaproteobacteria bacterium]|nr:MAG: hypothetical protein D6721_04190 [Gammaproteobacteria bacterium]